MDGLIERYKSASGEGMTADGCGDQRVVIKFLLMSSPIHVQV